MRSAAERVYFFPTTVLTVMSNSINPGRQRTYDFHQFAVVATGIEPVTSRLGAPGAARDVTVWSTAIAFKWRIRPCCESNGNQIRSGIYFVLIHLCPCTRKVREVDRWKSTSKAHRYSSSSTKG